MLPVIYRILFFIGFAVLLMSSFSAKAQHSDTIYTDTIKINEADLPKHSPTKASIFSALLPGLGQAYNKKYWKIPIVYVGIAIPLYFGLEQNSLFNDKRDAYINRINGDSTDQFLEIGNYYTNDGLLQSMDINRRNRDLMYIITGAMYILQIVDASVDAHMFYFNVSDDLSLNYAPMFYYDERTRKSVQGLSLSLTF